MRKRRYNMEITMLSLLGFSISPYLDRICVYRALQAGIEQHLLALPFCPVLL